MLCDFEFERLSLSSCAGNGSFVHLTDCTVDGGQGGDYGGSLFSGPGIGGPALWVNGSDLRSVQSDIERGAGGLDNINPFSDGTHAVALPAFVIPTNLSRGTLLHIQTRRTAFGDVELSNSTTIIVR